MWFLLVNAFIFSLSFFFGFSFKDFFVSTCIFFVIFVLYEYLKRGQANKLGYSYKRNFNFKYLLFCSLLSILTGGALRFLYFGSFYLESKNKSLKLNDHGKIIIFPLLIIFILGLISLLLNITFLYNVIIAFVLFNLVPIPGFDGVFLFASKVKNYKVYSILLLIVAIASMFLINNLFMIVLSFLIVLYIYYDFNTNEDKDEK